MIYADWYNDTRDDKSGNDAIRVVKEMKGRLFKVRLRGQIIEALY